MFCTLRWKPFLSLVQRSSGRDVYGRYWFTCNRRTRGDHSIDDSPAFTLIIVGGIFVMEADQLFFRLLLLRLGERIFECPPSIIISNSKAGKKPKLSYDSGFFPAFRTFRFGDLEAKIRWKIRK